MYLKINNKKIEIKELKSFKDRFKSLKFNLNKLDYGLCLPKKKFFSTDFFCQRVDVCFTDNDNKLLHIYPNLKSEKRLLHFDSKKVYIFPLETLDNLNVGEKLNIIDK